MCFPQAGISHEDEVFSTGHVASLGQFQKGGFGDSFYRRKIVICDLSEERELRPPDGRLDAFGLSICYLCLTQGQQKSLKREARSCCFLRTRLYELEVH